MICAYVLARKLFKRHEFLSESNRPIDNMARVSSWRRVFGSKKLISFLIDFYCVLRVSKRRMN